MPDGCDGISCGLGAGVFDVGAGLVDVGFVGSMGWWAVWAVSAVPDGLVGSEVLGLCGRLAGAWPDCGVAVTSAGRGVGHADEFEVEDQVGAWRDDGGASGFAVGELVGDVQASLAADVHALEAGVPAGDDAVGAVREGDGLLCPRWSIGGVELVPLVSQPV